MRFAQDLAWLVLMLFASLWLVRGSLFLIDFILLLFLLWLILSLFACVWGRVVDHGVRSGVIF